jgi:hypothetical protein
VLFFFFGDYILLILCVYAIRKKHLKSKRKTLFGLRFFYLSRGRRKGGRGGRDQERKTEKEQYTHRINSNSSGESIARERKYCFCNQGKITLLLQKAIPEIEKRKKKHNTQKIIKIQKKNLNYFYHVMLKRRRTLKRYIIRENYPLLYIFILI